MSTKLDKLGAELNRAREKAKEWAKRADILEKKYKEQEDTELCAISRSYSLTPEMLAKLLKETGNGLPDPSLAEKYSKNSQEENEAYEEES